MKSLQSVIIVVSVLALAAMACCFGPPDDPPPLIEGEDTAVPPAELPPTESAPVQTTEGLTLEITNQSGAEIWYVYISPTEAEDWGEDWLGEEDVIPEGETHLITGIPAGTYDIRVEDQLGEAVEIIWEAEIAEDLTWTVLGVGSLKVVNASETDIVYLYIAPTGSDSWGQDWLGEDQVIAAGESYVIENVPVDVYDIKATDVEDQNVETLYTVQLSGEDTWTVSGRMNLPEDAALQFEDTFEDNRNDWARDAESEGVTYLPPANGEYCIEIEQAQLAAWEWYEPFQTSDFIAEVVCTLSGAGDATCGLGFGADGDNLYWFEVSPADQSYALDLLLDDEWQEKPIDWTVSKNINPYGMNFMSLERIDGVLSVYVNGIWLADVDGQHFPTGQLGIGGSTYGEGNATVCLDNLRIWHME
jgi:hypothetical protein